MPVASTTMVPDGATVDGPGHPGAWDGATKLNPMMAVPIPLRVKLTPEPWLVVPDHWPSVPVDESGKAIALLWRSMSEPPGVVAPPWLHAATAAVQASRAAAAAFEPRLRIAE